MNSCSPLQGIFPTQGSNPGLPHCRRILYQLSHEGSPKMTAGVHKTQQKKHESMWTLLWKERWKPQVEGWEKERRRVKTRQNLPQTSHSHPMSESLHTYEAMLVITNNITLLKYYPSIIMPISLVEKKGQELLEYMCSMLTKYHLKEHVSNC